MTHIYTKAVELVLEKVMEVLTRDNRLSFPLIGPIVEKDDDTSRMYRSVATRGDLRLEYLHIVDETDWTTTVRIGETNHPDTEYVVIAEIDIHLSNQGELQYFVADYGPSERIDVMPRMLAKYPHIQDFDGQMDRTDNTYDMELPDILELIDAMGQDFHSYMG